MRQIILVVDAENAFKSSRLLEVIHMGNFDDAVSAAKYKIQHHIDTDLAC